jgi:hypothetical protein
MRREAAAGGRRGGRRVDALLAAVVVAVAAAAARDAIRAAPDPVPPAEALHSLGVSGRLLVSDDACARRRLALPTLELTEVPRIVGCSVFGHRGSLGIVGGELGWYAYPGGKTMLLTRSALQREVGGEVHVRAAAWLGRGRYAALLEQPGSERRLLALFHLDRVVHRVAELERPFTELRSSPLGGWFAAVGPDGRLLLYDADGRDVPLPADAERPHAIAWARDDAVAAVADAEGLLLFRPGAAEPSPVRLALRVRDLAWTP